MDIDDLIVWYFVLTEKQRPPEPWKPIGVLGRFVVGLLVLTLTMIVLRIVRR